MAWGLSKEAYSRFGSAGSAVAAAIGGAVAFPRETVGVLGIEAEGEDAGRGSKTEQAERVGRRSDV